ncbi:hypothetical protein AB8880_00895 [Alphaproteobacteria bacterium LSUCC0684]
MRNPAVKIRMLILGTAVVLMIGAIVAFDNIYSEWNEQSKSLTFQLAQGIEPDKIENSYWQRHFGSNAGIEIVTTAEYTIITQQDLEVNQLARWVEAIFRLPAWNVSIFQLQRRGEKLSISAKIISTTDRK